MQDMFENNLCAINAIKHETTVDMACRQLYRTSLKTAPLNRQLLDWGDLHE